jgi:hypothetical protein
MKTELGHAVRNVVAGVLALLLCAPQGWAWGREGHRLTALVAEQFLTPEAKEEISRLLGKESLADVASWADDFRSAHPETAKWHYVDIPGAAAAFDRDRDCPASATDAESPWRDCATDRILYFEGRLGDTSLRREDRAVALKFLVHLIGDIHQPMHALGDARGGNQIRVTFLGQQQCGTSLCNLHAVWDESIIEEQGLNDKKYLARLLEEIRVNHWERLEGGDPVAWANASHHYAVLAEAPNGAALMHDYVAAEARVVNAQLALGGLRLAHVLNRIFAAPEPGPSQPGRVPLPRPDAAPEGQAQPF